MCLGYEMQTGLSDELMGKWSGMRGGIVEDDAEARV